MLGRVHLERHRRSLNRAKVPARAKGINITDVLTAASLAKKIFWLKYYKQKNYPIYTLKDSIDSYIRDFYYGGRVEVFHLGKVPSEKLYYFDFTSLYHTSGCRTYRTANPNGSMNSTSTAISVSFR